MLIINKEVKTVKQMLKEYIVKNFTDLKEIVSEEELDNGMIVMTGVHKNGKGYEFYYNTINGFFRGIYDGWNDTKVYGLMFN